MKTGYKILLFAIILYSCKNKVNHTGPLLIFNDDSTVVILPDTIKIGPIEVLNKILKASTYEAARDSCKTIGKGWRLPTRSEIGFISLFRKDFNAKLNEYNFWAETDLVNQRIFYSSNWNPNLIPSGANLIAVRNNSDSIEYSNYSEGQKILSMLRFKVLYDQLVLSKKVSKDILSKYQKDEKGIFYKIKNKGSDKINPLTRENVIVTYQNLLANKFIPINLLSTTELIKHINRDNLEFNRLSSSIGEGGEMSIIIPSYIYINEYIKAHIDNYFDEWIFENAQRYDDDFEFSINSYNLKKIILNNEFNVNFFIEYYLSKSFSYSDEFNQEIKSKTNEDYLNGTIKEIIPNSHYEGIPGMESDHDGVQAFIKIENNSGPSKGQIMSVSGSLSKYSSGCNKCLNFIDKLKIGAKIKFKLFQLGNGDGRSFWFKEVVIL